MRGRIAIAIMALAACARTAAAQFDPFEFESFELHRERVIQPGQTITVYLPALKSGRYPFFDDFHKTAEGAIVAR